MFAMRQDGLFSLLGSLLIALLLFGARSVVDQRGDGAPTSTSGDVIPADSYKVVAVLDGDTVDVLRQGKPERLRFAGIDTPEKNQPFGQDARAALLSRIEGGYIRYVVRETDRYGRSIADVYDEKGHINLWLVRNGYAWHYKAYSKDPKLAAAETSAKSERLGLWAGRRPLEPWSWRKLSKVERTSYQ